MIRVALADDHQIVIDGLELILQDYSDEIEVVGTANTGEGLLGILAEHSVDVVILDISMPGMEEGATLKVIRKKHPRIKVLMLTMHHDARNFSNMLGMGARGYLLKNRGGKEAVAAIRSLAKGETYFSQEVKDAYVNSAMVNQAEEVPQSIEKPLKITNREAKILELLAEDLSENEMATRLFVSEKTIQSHKKNLKKKIGANSEKGLVRFAVENGYVKS